MVRISTTPMTAMMRLSSSMGVTMTLIPLYGPEVAILRMVVPAFITSSRTGPSYALSMTAPFSILIPRLSLLLAQTGNPPTRSCIANARDIISLPAFFGVKMSLRSRVNCRPPIMVSPAVTAPISAISLVGPVPMMTTSSFLRVKSVRTFSEMASSTG